MNIWHPPSTHYTHVVNHSPEHTKLCCSFRLNSWMLQRQDTADTENKNDYFSVQQGAHLFCRRCMFPPQLNITFPSFCFCVFLFQCNAILLMQSTSRSCPEHWQQGHREWVSCLSALLWPATVFTFKAAEHGKMVSLEKKTRLTGFPVSVPVQKPLLLRVSLLSGGGLCLCLTRWSFTVGVAAC